MNLAEWLLNQLLKILHDKSRIFLILFVLKGGRCPLSHRAIGHVAKSRVGLADLPVSLIHFIYLTV